MKTLLKALDRLDRFNEYVAKTTAWLLFPVLFIMTIEVIRRKFLNNPSIWSHEMSYFLCSAMLMLGMAYVFKIKGNVTIDIFYAKFSPRVKAAFDCFFFLVFFVPMWYFALQLMVGYLIRSYLISERDYWGIWFPLLWPLKAWTLAGSIMLVLQAVAEFIRDAICLVKGGERP
ncbi:MAG: TRAP transporter small permease subunit [Clostridia bacterium]|nr:TRAP transporter small permease subunit [Clostridia bacterium]